MNEENEEKESVLGFILEGIATLFVCITWLAICWIMMVIF